MSEIKKLIERLCPNGVEYKKLGEVTKKISTGLNPRKNFKLNTADAENYYVTVKEFTSGKIIFSEKTDRINEDALKIIQNRSSLEYNDILLSGIGTIGKAAVVDISTDNWNCSESVFLIKPNSELIISRFFMYLLQSNYVQNIFEKTSVGSTLRGIRKETLISLEIPVPPIEVQSKIVEYLDNFTELEAELEAQLEAELEARRKQYEYYRNQLLTFDKDKGARFDVKWMKLGEICEIRGRIGFRGYTRNDQVSKGEGVLSLSPANIVNETMIYTTNTYITWEKYEESPEIKTYEGDIIFCKTGSTVGKVALVEKLPCEATINPQLVVLKNIKVNTRFLKHILASYDTQVKVKSLAGVGSVPNISQAKLASLLIPIPPLEEQKRIVSILDRFEALTTDLQSGLPAEIEARRKQYEYYREKLLTFKRI